MSNKSGLRFQFKVWMDGQTEPLDINTIPIDTIRWERKSGKPIGEQIDSPSAEMLTWLAYTAGHRQKLINDSKFDDWAARVEDFEMVEDDEDDDTGGAPVPTRPAASES